MTTVEINRMALATLIDESQTVVDSITDEEWHKNHGSSVEEAIKQGKAALNGEENER
jgi:hypothetical protein